MSKHWIHQVKVQGISSRQAHADFPKEFFERELGREGFYGPATHMLHKHPPTSWIAWDGPLKPRAFDMRKIVLDSNLPWDSTEILTNAHCRIRYWTINKSMTQLARNGDGDELLFIHTGSGHLFCDYGHLEFRDGDYIMLPRSTMWRLEITDPIQVLLIEATSSSYQLPDKSIVGTHAFFDPAKLDTPVLDTKFEQQKSDSERWDVIVKRYNKITRITYPYNPLDAVGWHGTLAPVRINWRDMRPIMSHRYHIPPSAHTTFIAHRFVVCTFCPRPLETDPGALKIPFFHNNDDFDEVIFYHKGNFFSRDHIEPGMITLHPCGFTHGPHPKAFRTVESGQRKETDEVAVMIDTRDALTIEESAHHIEWKDYVYSWKEQHT